MTLFAHGKVLYSCSSGIVGLKKKQRRWGSAAFLIGAHFFTFLKNYLSFRSGTTVYRNKPLGKIVVILNSPMYLFNLFYVSYSKRYSHLDSQMMLRRKLAHRSAHNDAIIRESIDRSNEESASKVTLRTNYFSELLLRYTLSDARTCSSVYFRNRASWLNLSRYYCSVSERTIAAFKFIHLFRNTVLQSTELVLPPISGRFSSRNTTLSAFFSSYTSVSTVAATQPVNSRVIPLAMQSTFFSLPSFCNASFFPFLGGVYFGSHKDTNIPFTPFLIDTFKAHIFSFAQRYFNTYSTFSQAFFFSLCKVDFNSNVFVLSYRVSYIYLLSYFFFNLLSTCMPSTLSVVPSFSVSSLREISVYNDWSVLYHNLLVVNGLLFLISFNSYNYDSLCVILRSGLLTYQLHNDLLLTTSYPTVLKRRSFCNFLYRDSNVSDFEYYINKDKDMGATKSTLFATFFVHAYTKILRVYGRLASRYVNIFFYAKQVTMHTSPLFSDISVLYSMTSCDIKNVKRRRRTRTRSMVFFIRYQLRSHRRNASTVYTHLRRTTFFLDSGTTRRSGFFKSIAQCVSFFLKITPYFNAFLSNFFFGLLCDNRTIACMVFTRAMSSMYTVFFKHFLLFTLHRKLFTYSSFFTPDSRSLSYVYFFHFFFSVFFIRS